MTNALPPLVIISGPPGAGKSRLARPLANALGLPLLAKDQIKEELADAIGDAALPLSHQLGLAAIKQVYATADELIRYGRGVVLESFFHKGVSEPDLAPLLARTRAVLIDVRADEAILISRFERRMSDPDRHPIHNEGNRLGELRQYLAEGVADMLDLDCPHIVIDTTYGPIDIEEVVFMVQDSLEDEP